MTENELIMRLNDISYKYMLAIFSDHADFVSEITEPATVERLKDRFLEAQVLDGGDETLLTLVWETEEGTVTKDYGIGYSEETTQLENWLMDLSLSVVLGEGEA